MKFVTRAEWGARPPRSPAESINSTVTTGHWEGPGMGEFPHESCATKVRGIQAYHMDNNGWSDIAYNSLACPHGYVYEGRGVNKRSAANGTNSANATSCVVCWLGGEGDNFTKESKQAMVDAADWLGDPLQKGHRDWYPTACPGDEIYNWIYAGCPLEPVPEPKPEEPEVAAPPCIIEDSENRTWVFFKGPKSELYYRIGDDVVSLGGEVTDGISAVAGTNGVIDVYAYTPNGEFWSIHNTGSPDGWHDGGGWYKVA